MFASSGLSFSVPFALCTGVLLFLGWRWGKMNEEDYDNDER